MVEEFSYGRCRRCKEMLLLTKEGRLVQHNTHWRNQFGKENDKPLNDGTNWYGVKCIGGGAFPESDKPTSF